MISVGPAAGMAGYTRPTLDLWADLGHVPTMPNYRRNRIPGATYFFTVNLRDRRSGLLAAQIGALREAVREVRRQSPFRIGAWVVLPDYMHRLRTVPEGGSDFPDRWRRIKAAFSKSMSEPASPARLSKGERGIWQRGYWEHTIRDDCDYATHMDYIHFNPVKHGLTQDPGDWPFSGFRRCVAAEIYSADWLGGGTEPVETGERR
jgi:putative transposase